MAGSVHRATEHQGQRQPYVDESAGQLDLPRSVIRIDDQFHGQANKGLPQAVELLENTAEILLMLGDPASGMKSVRWGQERRSNRAVPWAAIASTRSATSWAGLRGAGVLAEFGDDPDRHADAKARGGQPHEEPVAA